MDREEIERSLHYFQESSLVSRNDSVQNTLKFGVFNLLVNGFYETRFRDYCVLRESSIHFVRTNGGVGNRGAIKLVKISANNRRIELFIKVV